MEGKLVQMGITQFKLQTFRDLLQNQHKRGRFASLIDLSWMVKHCLTPLFSGLLELGTCACRWRVAET